MDFVDMPTAQNAVKTLLQHMGEDPARDGLQGTPGRVAKMYGELTSGYSQDPQTILSTFFEQEETPRYDGIVLLTGIEFCSLCEHHLMPFIGVAHVAYIPQNNGRIVGISKLARLVECFARRLQVQERMNAQITDALDKYLQPEGVFVMLEAQHYCMKMRGVNKKSTMTTFQQRGLFQSGMMRDNVIQLIRS